MSGKPLPLSVVEGDFSTLDEETAVERKSVRVDLDIARLGVGHKDTVGGTGYR